jgi:DNA-binding transcriptional ArsR family regulator
VIARIQPEKPGLTFILVLTKITIMLTETAVLAAVASPRRREILRLVWENELSAGDISRAMPDVTFGAVSLQLRALADAGLLDMRAERQQRFYRARRESLGPVGRMLERMWEDALWRLKLAAELEQSRRGPRPRRTSPARARRKQNERTS